jgi:hypothetical protein
VLLVGVLIAAAPCAVPRPALADAPARADENLDLNRIPESVEKSEEASEAPSAANPAWRVYVENAASVYSYHVNELMPPPPMRNPAWQERLSLDSRGETALSPTWRLVHSARLNLFGEDTIVFPSDQTVRLDVRELYTSWEPVPRNDLDAGRINIKNGVAVGFNPTDYFKTRAVVDRSSQDASVLRENRLGTAMVREQTVWDSGAITFAFAPKLYEPSKIYDETRLPSFNPMLDRTNGQQRTLVKASFDLPGGVSAELLGYQENTRGKFGTNLSMSIGKPVVLFAEWSGGDRASLITEAIAYGEMTRSIPPGTPRILPGSDAASFQQDVAAGLSYATESKLTLYLEYDYHEAGMDRQNWKDWFRLGQKLRTIPKVNSLLWYIRGYAQDQGEPAARDAVFLYGTWTDAFIPDLNFTALANFSQYDNSAQYQLTATYFLSNRWTVGALGLYNAGSDRSVFGSLPQESSFILKVTRYL